MSRRTQRSEGARTNVSEENETMNTRPTTIRRGSMAGLLFALAVLAVTLFAPAAHAGIEDYAIESSGTSLSSAQAGAHADFQTEWRFTSDPTHDPSEEARPWASLRDVVTQVAPGLVGNPSAFPTCPASTFALNGISFSGPFCPTDTQVGMIKPGIFGFVNFDTGTYRTPLINLEPPPGDPHIVARLGFVGFFISIYIDIRLDPKRDDALTATVENIPTAAPITASRNTFWGVPTDESHDLERFNWFEALACGGICKKEEVEPGVFKRVPVPSGLDPTPFMSNPTSCGPAEVGTAVRSYEQANGFDYDWASLPDLEGCSAVPFEPTMSLQPTTLSAGASSGLDVELEIPQEGLTEPTGLRSSDLKEARVTLPQGVTLNSSAADGLGSCSEEQIGVDRNERQIVGVGGRGGPASLSFDGETTSRLPESATAAQVQAALEALPNIGSGDISVSGRKGGPWTVDFEGAYTGKDVQAIGGVNSELQQLAVRAEEGTYTLTFEGETTGPISYDAGAEAVEEALVELPALEPGDIEVSGGPTTGSREPVHQGFHIAFSGSRAGSDVPEISGTSSLLYFGTVLQVTTYTQGGSAVSTHTIKQGGSLGFTDEAPSCPQSSKIASGEISTPVLSGPLRASVYLASQSANPFKSLFGAYLVASGEGVMIKVPARIDVDPNTGQVTTTFTQNPQQPFEDLELHFKGGNRGLITTPDKCGTYASTYELTPWSGNPPVKGTSEFTLDENCQPKPFAPGFHAGSETALAGSFTTFATQVTNEPGAPDLTRITVDLPEGLSAQLAGVSICPEAALGALPTGAGTGAAQLANPSCPANSQVGTVQAGAGSGSPFYVKTGKAYLSGPYKGAPLSLAVLTPAVAGPFDLGNVLVRVPISLDRKTARAHAVSDQIPTMLSGIPLDLRDVRVLLDRQGFALNPTSCEPKQTNGVIEGAGGVFANVSDRFQVGECAALGFKPKLSLKLKGGTKRGDHPALTAVFRPRPGDANTSYVQVALPKSEFLDQGHIGTVCTRVQFDADQCPKASVYGSVTASTPLLDQPLTGNVYLRSSEHELPDLVMDLRGPASQPIHLEADGRIDSIKGGIRTTFEFVPDAPITRVVLKMKGAKKGLLQNSRDICASPFKANASFAAHNGRTLTAQPQMQARCKGSARKGKGKGHAKKHRG
jgi:hypothetical protein